MKVYLAHSTAFDFKSDLYDPINASDLKTRHEIILPHAGFSMSDSRNIIARADIIIAEVSYPSTGLGIELGWASSLNKRIVALHRVEKTISSSIGIITTDIRAYTPDAWVDTLTALLDRPH